MASPSGSTPIADPSGSLRPGVLLALGSGLGAGLLAGLVFGLADGIGAGLRTQTSGVGAWAGCLAAAVATYAVPAALALAALALLLRGQSRERLQTRLLTLGLGAGLFFELYWWTRPVFFPGRPATDPRRLAIAAALLVAGLAGGWLLARVLRRLPRAVPAGLVAIACAATLAGALFGYAGLKSDARGRITERNRDLPNVLIFVVDALRDDVLGPYGNTHVKTPVVDALAERGTVFQNARVQAPYTWTSFGSFLTGKYPRRHGLVKMAPGVRMAPNVTLAWHLESAPFRDAARGRLEPDDYVGATFMTGALSNGSGLMRGFDFYFEAMQGHALTDNGDPWSVFRSELLVNVLRSKLEQRFDEAPVSSATRDWLEQYGDRRFVSLVHYYSTHTPYAPPARFRQMYCDPDYEGPFEDGFWSWHREAIERGEYAPTPADVEQIRNLYYAGTTQADFMIGQVLEDLEARGVLDETIVVVMSDHGEELGDHGLWEHNFMYETNLRIPLILAGPGIPAGQRVEALVESIDLVPTLCELVGVEPPGPSDPGPDPDPREQIDGHSLVPLLRGETDRGRAYSFAENGRFLSVQGERWKLILRRGALDEEAWSGALSGEGELPRFFDLNADPGELANQIGAAPADAGDLFRVLAEYDAEMPVPIHEMIESQRDQDAEILSALGYADGIGQGAEDGDEDEDADTDGSPRQ